MKCFNGFVLNDRVINLDYVSNIAIDNAKKRIVFNFDFSVDVMTPNGRKVAQSYVYIAYDDTKDRDEIINKIKAKFNEMGVYIIYIYDDFGELWNLVNFKKVSSFHFNDDELSFVFNMNTAVDRNGRGYTDFKYKNFFDVHKYEDFKAELLSLI